MNPYNFRVDVCGLLAERSDTKTNIKLGGFRSQLQASYVSCHTEELWYNESVCLWMTIYIYIYIYIYLYPILNMHKHIYTDIFECMYVCMYVCKHKDICSLAHIHVRTHIHARARTGNRIQVRRSNYTATCLPSRKLYKLDEPDTQDTAGEARTNSSVIYSYGPPHMAMQKQDDQLEHTYSSSARIRDIALKTCQKRFMIGRSGERGSRISMLAARHDDDDDDDIYNMSFPLYVYIRTHIQIYVYVLLWTPTYGRAKAGRSALTYIQQLCEDTGCSPEDLQEAILFTNPSARAGYDTRSIFKFLCCFFFHYVSAKFHLWPSSGDFYRDLG